MRVGSVIVVIILLLLLFHFWGKVKNVATGAGLGGGNDAPGSGVLPPTGSSLGGCGCE
jgi:hypothetical protein